MKAARIRADDQRLDTNIIVSALLQPLGPSAQIFSLALAGSIRFCVTGAIFAEYEEVVRRPRFRLDEVVIAGALESIRLRGFWVKPSEAIRICSDPDDIVTGNTRHFPAEFRKTAIVTPRRFLDLEFRSE